MAFYQFRKQQKVNTSLTEIWEFISSPSNLKEITPEYMGFDITSKNLPNKMYAGMVISYAVKPLLGIKTIFGFKLLYIFSTLFNNLFFTILYDSS